MTKLDRIYRRYEKMRAKRNRIMFKICYTVADYACQYIKQYQDDGGSEPALLSDIMGEAHFVVFQAMCSRGFDENHVRIESNLVTLINDRLLANGVLKLRVSEYGDTFALKPRILVEPFV